MSVDPRYRYKDIFNPDGSFFNGEDYDRLLFLQDSKCAICKTPQTKRRLATDHNHNSGMVRGLLCSGCNLGLGGFRDSIAYLKTAINYLRNQPKIRRAEKLL